MLGSSKLQGWHALVYGDASQQVVLLLFDCVFVCFQRFSSLVPLSVCLKHQLYRIFFYENDARSVTCSGSALVMRRK